MHPGPRRSLLLALALALAGACLVPAPARADEADDHFAKANEAFQAEKYAEALPEYLAAWKLKKSYDIASLLGITELRLAKNLDAAEHLSFALAHWAPGADDDLRQNTQANFAEVKKAIVTIHLKPPTKGATLKINGGKIGPASIDKDLYFEPGRYVISADAPGYLSASRTLPGKPGDYEIVTMILTADTSSARGPIPGIALGAVGLVGIVVGGALIGAAEGKKSEALKLHDDILSASGNDALACSTGTGDEAKCKALKSAATTSDGMHNGGVAALVFGIVAGVAAGGYFLLPQRKTGPAKMAIVPVAGPSTGGLMVSGAF